MAQVIWTEPALADLDAIADYIALDNPEAAKALVQRVFRRVQHLAAYPKSGSKPRELKGWRFDKSSSRRVASSIGRMDRASIFSM
jgi:plasmid stabilization system protein ParE